MAASLELAISAIRSGRKEEGRQLLNLLIQQNPNDEKAWLWMSSVVDADEQRARCLYHVLAINPNSEIARKGLQVLGIVVSDSRPVKVPRDSQPIKIPKPTPESALQEERRPFLIDPQTITDELPFTPLKAPFTENIQASPSVLAINVDEEVVDEQEKEGYDNNDFQTQPEQDTPEPIAAASTAPAPITSTPEQSEQLLNSSKPVPVVNSVETKDETPQSPAKHGLLARLPQPASADPSSADTQDMVSPSEHPLSGQTQTLPDPSKPVPVVYAEEAQIAVSPSPVQAAQPQNPSEPVPVVYTAQPQNPSQPIPVVRPDESMSGGGQPVIQAAQLQNPSEPVPVIYSNVNPGMSPQPQVQPGAGPLPAATPLPGQLPMPGSGPLVPGNQTYYPSPQPAPSGQQPYDTRPSQPMPVIYPNSNMGIAQSNPASYYPVASPQVPAHASATVGMSAYQPMQPQNPSQPMSPMHSNTTMGMPLSAYNSQPQHPSEPVPVIHPNNAPGMYSYGQIQPSYPSQGMAVHSSSTMMMPVMSQEEARARLAAGQAIPTANATAMALQGAPNQPGMVGNPMDNAGYAVHMGRQTVEDEEDETGEEVNILAVIIFGTLSVTALGGLGMLILLVFTTPAG